MSKLLSGLSVVALSLSLALGAAGSAAAQTKLLNVSYDPTRELYKDFNEAFAKKWKADTGEDVTIQQSQMMLAQYETGPRLASVFATQQRWLMGHAALSLYFRWDRQDARSGFNAARFLDLIREHAVASRNTADAFLKEMLHFNFAHHVTGGSDRRTRNIEPAQKSLDMLGAWAAARVA